MVGATKKKKGRKKQMTKTWKMHTIQVEIQVDTPDGVYLPPEFILSDQERQDALKNGMSEHELETAEREWAMFNIAKRAFEALGITVNLGTASSRGHHFKQLEEQ